MPKRLLRDWTDSMKLDGISADAERLFIRLIMKADDFGRFHSDPRLVKAMCFPLVDNLRPADVGRWLDELSHRQLVLRYEADGRKCLAILDFGQRLKESRAKFPPPHDKPADWLASSSDFREVPGSSGKFPAEEKRRDTEDEEKGKTREALDAGASSSADADPSSLVVDAWNAAERLPRVQSVTADRKRSLRARMSEQFFREHYAEAIRRVASSQFCTGSNDRGWKATFDWFLQPGTIAKVMEGKYDGKQAKTVQLRKGEEAPVWDPMEEVGA